MAGEKFTTTAHASAAATDKIPALKSTTKGYLTPVLTSALAISPPQGRLTLTTAVPVTTADVTAATTIYYTPYVGDRVPIYDGTDWRMTTFAELSNATAQSSTGKAGPAAVANNSNYDLFVWSDAGTIRLTRGPLWTSDTGRGTGAGTTQLTLTNGIYLNTVAITNGPGALRGTYVGTVRSDGSAQINDSLALRLCWNMYNRRFRAMQRLESTDTWAGSGAASWRQMNNSTANQVAYVCGLAEDAVSVRALAKAAGSTSTGRACRAGIGVDSVAAPSGLQDFWFVSDAQYWPFNSSYSGVPGLGYHFIAALEYDNATETRTWAGDQGGTQQCGLTGSCMA